MQIDRETLEEVEAVLHHASVATMGSQNEVYRIDTSYYTYAGLKSRLIAAHSRLRKAMEAKDG